MKSAKQLCYILGILYVAYLLIGLGMLLWKLPVTVTVGVIVICLSLCFGILTINPFCLFSLLVGICFLMLPPQISGIAVIALATAGAAANPLLYRMLTRR